MPLFFYSGENVTNKQYLKIVLPLVFLFAVVLCCKFAIAAGVYTPIETYPMGSILNNPVGSIPDDPNGKVEIGTYYYNSNGQPVYDPTGADHKVITPVANVVGPIDIVTPESFPKSDLFLLGHMGVQSALISDISKFAAEAADGIATGIKQIIKNCIPSIAPSIPVTGNVALASDGKTYNYQSTMDNYQTYPQQYAVGAVITSFPSPGYYRTWQIIRFDHTSGPNWVYLTTQTTWVHVDGAIVNWPAANQSPADPLCLQTNIGPYVASPPNKQELLDFLKAAPDMPVDNSKIPPPVTQEEINHYYNDNSTNVANTNANSITDNSTTNNIAAGNAAAGAAAALAAANNSNNGGSGSGGDAVMSGSSDIPLPGDNIYSSSVDNPESSDFLATVRNFISNGIPVADFIKYSSLTSSGSPVLSFTAWEHPINIDFSTCSDIIDAAGLLLVGITTISAFLIVIGNR